MVNISRKAPIIKKTKCIYEEPVYLTQKTYTRRVKEPIHIRLHPNNINRDSEIDIPEAWNKTVFL